jgi:DNA recombination protein RmuC
MDMINITLLVLCFFALITGFAFGFLFHHYRNKNSTLELHQHIGELNALLQAEKELSKHKIAAFEQAKKNFRDEFTVLSQSVLDEKTLKFTKHNSEQLGILLNPLREQLGEFEKKMRESNYQQTQERVSLTTEIKHLKELNHRMSQDALNLTQALKGGNKLQGAWGEIILTRVLEKSGLEQGREYEIQVHSTNEEGKAYRPDAIIRLPEGRDVVVDAKVSLTAYLRFQEADEQSQRDLALEQHILSIRQHMRNLASKEYQKIVGINSLDFVLLFLPIEAALSTALQQENALFDEALASNIILVTPTTLLTTLRTVNTMWRVEQQNKNAIEIANQAGNLYDKFVGFVDDLQEVGHRLQAAQKAHDVAIAKLNSGRGNLVTRVENLRKLGAKASKAMALEVESEEE